MRSKKNRVTFFLTLSSLGMSMAQAEIESYGSWKSPITSSMIVESAIKLGEVSIDEGKIYWNEIRPSEKGRSVVAKWEKGQMYDLLPAPYNARTRVHEYGGGSFLMHKGTLFFSNFKDQHFYALLPSGQFLDLTQADNKRYANPVFDENRSLIYAVEEEHRSDMSVINRLVKIDPTGKVLPEVVHEGYDFYSSPVIHPQGNQIAFLTWNHPNMPWDGTELWVADLERNGNLFNVRKIAGGVSESVFQPEWTPDGTLHFVSDRTGWWNLYRLKEKGAEALCPMEAEFGSPQWVFNVSRYCFLPDGQIACIYTIKGADFLSILDPETKELKNLDLPFTSYGSIHVCENTLIFSASSPTEIRSFLQYDLKTAAVQILRKSKDLHVDSTYISEPETLEFPTANEQTAFGFYYPPKNKDFTGPEDEKPPLIVKSHGGPSSHVSPTLNLEIQFWTSRGFGFLDVNYGGSTGYGRAYRERLKGNWGIVDIDDCINGALYLADQGRVDRERLAIKGGSAGGYTTLAALTFRDVFKAGASYYGVSDLEALATDTHKFESRYLDGLIGVYPEQRERYIEYSPVHHTEKLSCPIILLQGAEDKVVPPSQAKMMFEALKAKKIPVAYILFPEEGHGFRIAENIKKALDSELYFYSKIFHFKPSDELEPITIHHLK